MADANCYLGALQVSYSSSRDRWKLTQEAFHRLLDHFDPDPDRAAERFQALHLRLVLFFRYNRCRNAEHWADETLDRVAKRLSEDQTVSDITAFARGIARLTLLEAHREQHRERELAAASQYALGRGHDEQALTCLDRCMAGLSPENRELIFRYYSAPVSRLSADRKKLAEQLGITIDALRTRALRIRHELEACVTECRERQGRLS